MGQLIGSWPGATILTVCSHAPETPTVTDYDQRSGFSTARQAAYCRRMEDRAACAVLGASPVYLGLVDGQYGTPMEMGQVGNAVGTALDEIRPRVVVAPLGLVHPDHVTVAQGCRDIYAEFRELDWWVYEDMPSRVLYPESVRGAMIEWEFVNPDGPPLTLGFLGTSDIERKAEAVECYGSQLWALDRHAVLCPERVWRVTP